MNFCNQVTLHYTHLLIISSYRLALVSYCNRFSRILKKAISHRKLRTLDIYTHAGSIATTSALNSLFQKFKATWTIPTAFTQSNFM